MTVDQLAEKTNCVDDSPLWRTGGVVTPRCKLLVMEGESAEKRGHGHRHRECHSRQIWRAAHWSQRRLSELIARTLQGVSPPHTHQNVNTRAFKSVEKLNVIILIKES